MAFQALPTDTSSAILRVAAVVDLPTASNGAVKGDIRYVDADDELYTFNGSAWAMASIPTGTVTGPVSSTDEAIARFDGTGGATLQNSVLTVSDTGVMSYSGALWLHKTGTDSFFAGLAAGSATTTGSRNTGLGRQSLASITSGSDNSAVGYIALVSATTGGKNTAMGRNALVLTSTGSDNTAFGYLAGGTVTTGAQNTHVGSGADSLTAALTNAASFGYNAKVAASNWQVFGNASVSNWYLGSASATPITRYLFSGYSSGVDGAGGDLRIGASQSTGTGAGGSLYLLATPASTVSGSTVNTTVTPQIAITPGTSVTGATTAIQAQTTGQTLDILRVNNAASVAVFSITAAGAVGVSGAVGSAGQVLTSAGPATPPTWTTPAGASGATGSVQFASSGAFASDSANLFWDDASNSLGIGTAAPRSGSRLEVTGGRSYFVASGSPYAIGLGRDDNTNFSYFLGTSADASPDLIFSNTDGTEQVRIDGATGYVGIGTATPTARLHILGTTDALQTRITAVSGQSTDIMRVENNAGTAPYMTVGPDGDLRLTENGSSGLFWDASTRRLSINGGPAPFAALQVDGTGYISGLLYAGALQAPGSGDFVIGSDTASDIVLKVNGANEALRLVSDKTTVAAGSLKLSTVGSGFYIKEGANATMGTAVMVAGAVTVNTTKVTANSRIYLTTNVAGGVVGAVYENGATRVAGASFDIASTSVADTSTVAWHIVEPA